MKLNRFVLFSLIFFVVSACSTNSEAMNPAPAFTLEDTDGNTHQLAHYKGQKVYIKFWASWCPICLSGMNELNTLVIEEKDFVVLTLVSPGTNGEKNTESFKKWWGSRDSLLNIEVLLDEEGLLTEQYGVIGYPTSVYINSDGNLVKVAPGHYSNEQIKAEFNNIN